MKSFSKSDVQRRGGRQTLCERFGPHTSRNKPSQMCGGKGGTNLLSFSPRNDKTENSHFQTAVARNMRLKTGNVPPFPSKDKKDNNSKIPFGGRDSKTTKSQSQARADLYEFKIHKPQMEDVGQSRNVPSSSAHTAVTQGREPQRFSNSSTTPRITSPGCSYQRRLDKTPSMAMTATARGAKLVVRSGL